MRIEVRTLGKVIGAALALAVTTSVLPAATAQPGREVEIELFSREGCPHCAAAERWLATLPRERPELRIREHDVLEDPAALARLRELAAKAGVAQVAVPAFHVRGRLFVGFDAPETTGAAIVEWLDREQPSGAGAPQAQCAPEEGEECDEPATSAGARFTMRVPFWGELDVRELGLPAFTIAVGLVDGFNPCAMWVLLFVLSMLVHLRSRTRMALIGGTFVVVSGVVYFAFMAAWLEFFMLVGFSRALQVALGTLAIAIGALHVKDFFAFKRGFSIGIPEAAKPGIYRRVRQVLQAEHLAGALFAAVVLATMVNVVELMCTAGLPALYTQVLTSQDVPRAGYYGYLVLYNLVYMLDDTAMLAVAVVTLGHHKLQERGGRVLKLVSGLVMSALGVLLLFRPAWLAWS